MGTEVNILPVSDLHLEFQFDGGGKIVSQLPDADMIVVAGDLSDTKGLPGALKLLARKYEHVVYVPGNHDWYGGRCSTMLAVAEAAPSNVHWLSQSESTVIEGQCFVGCTLWYPDTPDARFLTDEIPDFRRILDVHEWVWDAHEAHRDHLAHTVGSDDIVVTHHLPSPRSIAAYYRNDRTNCYFLGDCTDIIMENKPKLWLHGHTHNSCDYTLGETRVLCNPYGYPGAENKAFSREFIEL